MTKCLVLTLIFIFSKAIVYCQLKNSHKPPQPLTLKQAVQDDRNHNCVRKQYKSFTIRLKNYPFNLSSQIQVVSFENFVDPAYKLMDTVINDSLPRLNDTVCYSKLKEVKNLTILQVEKLTDILYNYGFGGPISINVVSQCYNPRNAILFLDSTGKVFEFLEICFECERIKQSSPKIVIGDICNQKLDMLKNFFRNNGVEYGTANKKSNFEKD